MNCIYGVYSFIIIIKVETINHLFLVSLFVRFQPVNKQNSQM